MVDFMENPNLKWMTSDQGVSPFQEFPIKPSREDSLHQSSLKGRPMHGAAVRLLSRCRDQYQNTSTPSGNL